MDDHSWIYRDSPQGFQRMDYCNGIQGFINFVTSIPINFTGGGIRCPCKKCENKKVFASRFCNDASSTQRVHGELPVLVCTQRSICS
jgi:hypothetical protein